jgi:hypothetical protein
VAEQLALEDRLGQRSAVDRQERLLLAPACEVNQLGEFFLAGAGFTRDQHWQIVVG